MPDLYGKFLSAVSRLTSMPPKRALNQHHSNLPTAASLKWVQKYSSAAQTATTSRTFIFKSMLAAMLWTSLLSLTVLVACLAYIRYQQQFLTPSVALVLGGAPERERFAAQFAKTHPSVKIWVSSGSNPEYAKWVFDQARIPSEQWQLDYRAVDTVTNFTTLVDELEAMNVKDVYLITSDYHMRRASVIAQIVLGSRGISFKPVVVPAEQSLQHPETLLRDVRDGVRSLLWLATGQTGSDWKEAQKQP